MEIPDQLGPSLPFFLFQHIVVLCWRAKVSWIKTAIDFVFSFYSNVSFLSNTLCIAKETHKL